MWPHWWQPTRLPRPWDSPGKNTGVGCHFFLQCMKVKSEREVSDYGLELAKIELSWDVGHWVLLSVGHFGKCWWTIGEGLARSSLSLPASIVCFIFLIFSKNQILVPLIFFLLFSIALICSVFKIIFFILLALGLFCSFSSGYLRCKLKLLILDSSSFSVLACVCMRVSCSFMFEFLQPYGPQPTRLPCLWNSPGKNTGVTCYSILHQSWHIML